MTLCVFTAEAMLKPLIAMHTLSLKLLQTCFPSGLGPVHSCMGNRPFGEEAGMTLQDSVNFKLSVMQLGKRFLEVSYDLLVLRRSLILYSA